MSQPSLDPEYFARVYARTSDPWNFASSPYENEKYAATIAALDGRRFTRGLEVGCSIGVLTALLAEHCDDLLAIDINDRALDAARTRCATSNTVRFERMTFPQQTPTAAFDFVIISEVAYYWSDADLAAAIDFVSRAARGGTLELVHFLPKVDDYVRDGDAVHERFLADARLRRQSGSRTAKYRIDILTVE